MRLESVVTAIAAGIMLAPEDRQRDGLLPDLSIRENISLASLEEFSRGGFLERDAVMKRVRKLAAQMRIAAADLELPVTSLSGGNQQKVVLARCLMRRPVVLLLDEPTRGVDVRAKTEIYKILRELAVQGLSILFTSSEIEETKLLADRILVLARGRVTASLWQKQLRMKIYSWRLVQLWVSADERPGLGGCSSSPLEAARAGSADRAVDLVRGIGSHIDRQ